MGGVVRTRARQGQLSLLADRLTGKNRAVLEIARGLD